ncbi:hypothetical protein AAIP42_001565, partial [Flavobacterium psychrophilum]|nr:hypothetical protein [Flavobacterium psychrophilum]
MLEIFRTGIEKGDLKKDQTYYINRDLRNELIGHPIRKDVSRAETIQKKCDSCGKILKPKNKLALLSSTFFSYQESEDEIEYLLYHRDNDFRFESKTFKIIDIQERHRLFLETYLDIILEKFKIILNDYLSEISKLEKVIEKGNFETVLKLVELYLEAIFKYSPIYNKESLIKIHARANEHRRYKNFIDTFNIDLRKNLSEKKNSVNKILDRKVIDKSPFQNSSLPKFKIAINTTNTKGFNVKPHKD